MASGDFHRGLEQMLPSGVGNAMQALREGLGEGKVDKSGTILTPSEDVTAWQTALKAVGLKTTADTEQNLLQQKVILTEQHYAAMRKDIGEDYVQAKRDGDAEKAADARQRWMRMAASMRTQGMKAPTLTDLNNYWGRELRDQRQVVGGVVVKRSDRELARRGI
ncbi:MAG TPA: hypothetical protein VHM25_11600, partial [Polyangiaceae bacterium]|jgi:hypothetical protein|nr:hypothetical protein [Polyangiaceae bacterium]